MNLRRIVFWILDSIRGGEIRKNYNEILQNDPLVRERHLNDILDYAQMHVPYYRGLKLKTLSEFPVIKQIRIQRTR